MKPLPLPTRVSRWGEGPVWWRGKLYYVDIEGAALVAFDPRTGTEKLWQVDQRIGFALPCRSGRWIWGGDHGLFFLDLDSGVSSPITDPEAGIPDNRFNDAGISPDGRLFAGTISLKKMTGSACLYRLDPDLSCHIAYPGVTNSNGIAWTADGHSCYYIDTPSHNLYQFDYLPGSGLLTNCRTLLNTKGIFAGVPDGMTIDAEGKLWIAFCHGSSVIRWDPTRQALLTKIDFPVSETTSLCFGGTELKELYVTTGLNAKLSEAHAGKVFVIKDTGTRGLPQIAFRD